MTLSGQTSVNQRAVQLDELMSRELESRLKGCGTSDATLIAQHPDLMPDLVRQLSVIERIRDAVARGGFRANNTPPDILSFEELRAPITSYELNRPAPNLSGYVIEEWVGEGGQAVVYSARHSATGRSVAIKILRGGTSPDDRQLLRLDRETELLSSLDHPSIVTVLDRGRTRDGSFFLAMPLIRGQHLDDYWNGAPRADLQKIVGVFIRLCDALEEVHCRGIVHRDLKPSNIIVDRRDVPHVVDFGLARDDKSHRNVSQTGQVIGSMPWTSPEQLRGLRATPASDVYAIGTMLYEALTGQPPYVTDRSVSDTVHAILHVRPPPPSRVARTSPLPPELDEVVLRALAKEPHLRYQSAGELAACLRSPTPTRRILPGRLRWMKAIALGGMLVAAMSGAHQSTSSAIRHVPTAPFPLQPRPSFINSIGMRLIRIPAGDFLFGAPADAPGFDPTERQRRVKMSAFCIAACEVTEAQWSKVFGGSSHSARPRVNVTWADADGFCSTLSSIEGRVYRLPTSAEWEYVATNGGLREPFGTAASGNRADCDDVAWNATNSSSFLHPVAGKAPTTWGVYDLLGNAAEWCSDRYSQSKSFDPPTTPILRIVRGGSAWDGPDSTRVTAVAAMLETAASERVGFRLVCESEEKSKN